MTSTKHDMPADYIMGHSDHEIARLQLQATLLAPVTRRLLEAAGLRRGMRVLDVGCGTGEVSVMTAEIVGRTGEVVGIDRSETAVRAARTQQRALPNVRFEEATVDEFITDKPFDLAFGRYLLMHQPQPAKLVRAAAALLRPGGVIAFHEIVLLDGFRTAPRSPLWDQVNSWFIDAFRELLSQVDIACNLVGCFAEAGVSAPMLFSESLVGPAATSPITPWFVATLRTLAPDLARLFGVSAEELDIETLAERLRAEGQRNNTQAFSCRQVCAWARA